MVYLFSLSFGLRIFVLRVKSWKISRDRRIRIKYNKPKWAKSFNHLCFSYKKKQFPGRIFKMKHLFFVSAGTYSGCDCSRDILQISKKQRQNEEPSASRVLQQQSEQPRMRSVWRLPSLYYNSAPSSGETSFQEPPSLQDYVVAKRLLVKTRL